MTRALTNQAEAQYTSFLRKEPVIAAHLATSLVGFVLTLLVTHGVITNTQSSAVTQEVAPMTAAAMIGALGFVMRRFVSPAWKSATGDTLPASISEDADPYPDDLGGATPVLPVDPIVPIAEVGGDVVALDLIPAQIIGPVTATQAMATAALATPPPTA